MYNNRNEPTEKMIKDVLEDTREALRVADRENASDYAVIEWALAKHIPESVRRSESKGFICPNCGLRAVVLETYCHYCGQKLHWEFNETNI